MVYTVIGIGLTFLGDQPGKPERVEVSPPRISIGGLA